MKQCSDTAKCKPIPIMPLLLLGVGLALAYHGAMQVMQGHCIALSHYVTSAGAMLYVQQAPAGVQYVWGQIKGTRYWPIGRSPTPQGARTRLL